MHVHPITAHTVTVQERAMTEPPSHATTTDKICLFVKNAALFAQKVIQFPLRYLGSKSWSIPGVIVRAPYIAIKRAVVKKTTRSFKEELLGTGYHREVQKVLDKDELKPYLKYALAAAFVHRGDGHWIEPLHYTLFSNKSLAERMKGLPSTLEARGYCLFDTKTHLKLSILIKDNEVVIACGTTNSQESEVKAGTFTTDIAAIANFLGFSPAIYEEADQVVAWLKKQPEIQGKQIVLTGSCFGASLASYVALKHGEKAISLNPFPLGAGLQVNISKQHLSHADQHVTNICARGDQFSNSLLLDSIDTAVSGIGIKTPGSFGKRVGIPTAYKKRLDTHRWILGSMMQHLGFDKRTKPAQIPESYLATL